MKSTELASGQLNGSDPRSIVLVEPPDLPPQILIRWPSKPTVCTPGVYDAVAASAMRLLANAVVELAAIKVWKKL
jgi:hypothetical protein